MVENAANAPVLSVIIVLPEAIDRRLERWSENMEGASWPEWGGHITLVPGFVPRGSEEAVREAVERVCATMEPFSVRFGEAVAVQDKTRPDYYTVLLKVEEVDPLERSNSIGRDDQVEGSAQVENDRRVEGENGTGEIEAEEVVERSGALQELRRKLLAVLEPLREDLFPQLVAKPFLPHVTLAMGLGEAEAQKVVRRMRAEPLVAKFEVDTIWLVKRTGGQETRVERLAVPLGRVAPVGVWRD